MDQIKITCPYCNFSKSVDAGKIPENLKNVSCPKCKKSFPFEMRKNVSSTEEFSFDESQSRRLGPQQKTPLSHSKFCSTCGEKIHIDAEICPHCGVRVPTSANSINKVALLLITFFLGGIGGHKFYTKKYLIGTLYLVFFWTYIPGIISFVEFITYAIKSEAELRKKFPETSSAAIVVAAVVPIFGVAIIGILAAIAIPQFAAYRQKAYNASAKSSLSSCKVTVDNYYANHGSYPNETGQLDCHPSNSVALYYLPINTGDFQLISFHDKGNKAFIVDASSSSIEEDKKEDVEQYIEQEFGVSALELKFHFLERVTF